MGTEHCCQSCGMPMGALNDMYGTHADGTKSEDYCELCYTAGSFNSDITMEEMIETCVPHVVAANPGMTLDQARKMMCALLPNLKRWQ